MWLSRVGTPSPCLPRLRLACRLSPFSSRVRCLVRPPQHVASLLAVHITPHVLGHGDKRGEGGQHGMQAQRLIERAVRTCMALESLSVPQTSTVPPSLRPSRARRPSPRRSSSLISLGATERPNRPPVTLRCPRRG
jgi:hypothetical protein